MANEIYMQGTLQVNKNSLVISRSANLNATMTGSHSSACAQGIATTPTALSIASDVASAGMTWYRNTDSTNACSVGIEVSGTYYPFLNLMPGEMALGRMATKTVYAQATTATVVLEWWMLEA